LPPTPHSNRRLATPRPTENHGVPLLPSLGPDYGGVTLKLKPQVTPIYHDVAHLARRHVERHLGALVVGLDCRGE